MSHSLGRQWLPKHKRNQVTYSEVTTASLGLITHAGIIAFGRISLVAGKRVR